MNGAPNGAPFSNFYRTRLFTNHYLVIIIKVYHYLVIRGENMDLSKIMTTTEAAQRWGYKENTIRAAIARGRFDRQIREGMLRKSGDTWLIHEKAMYEVYGDPKE
jgi:hypothetical protein